MPYRLTNQVFYAYNCRKSDNACNKIDHNFRVLISSIPPALLGRNVGELLKTTNGDLNIAIFQENLKLVKQGDLSTNANTNAQTNIFKDQKMTEKV